jgi:CRISPR-associated protein Csd1
MILKALCDLYDVLGDRVAPFGYQTVAVSYALTLGKNLSILDFGKKDRKHLVVPWQDVRTSGVKAYFLCDNAKYFIQEGKNFDEAKKLHLDLLDGSGDKDAKLVCDFFKTWDFDTSRIAGWNDKMTDGLIVFQNEEGKYIHESPTIKRIWDGHFVNIERGTGVCLVTGEKTQIESQHPNFSIAGGQASGAYIVNFNKSSFYSYGKEGGENATVSTAAISKYSEALGYLLRNNYIKETDKKTVVEFTNKTLIGDTTIVFWAADKDEGYAETFAMFENPPKKEERDETQERLIKDILTAVKIGKKLSFDRLDADKQFYILGLTPNAARLSIRFFLTNTFGKFIENLAGFWNTMEIVGFDPKPLKQILAETAVQGKFENISPLLAGRMLSSILTGGNLPMQIYTAILERIKAEPARDVNPTRAAIIKAYLIRNIKKEIGMSLDKNETDIAYRLGRLFAILESAQYKAMKNLNATIKDRYFSAAMTTPSNVFPTLVRMNANYDNPIYIDKEIGEIIDGISKLPPKLDIDGQGMFVLGYYHQRQENFNNAKEQNND